MRVLTTAPLNAVLAPGLPRQYTGPGSRRSMTLTEHRTSSIARRPSTATTLPGLVGSAEEQSDAALLPARTPTVADPQWLTIPTDLPARVTALAAALSASATNRLDAVNPVERLPAHDEKYNLEFAGARQPVTTRSMTSFSFLTKGSANSSRRRP